MVQLVVRRPSSQLATHATTLRRPPAKALTLLPAEHPDRPPGTAQQCGGQAPPPPCRTEGPCHRRPPWGPVGAGQAGRRAGQAGGARRQSVSTSRAGSGAGQACTHHRWPTLPQHSAHASLAFSAFPALTARAASTAWRRSRSSSSMMPAEWAAVMHRCSAAGRCSALRCQPCLLSRSFTL